MKINILFQITGIAILSYSSSFSLANEVGSIDVLEPIEKFKQLCVMEYNAKLEHDQNLASEQEEELLQKYNDLMETRITLGAQLDQHFCPPELIGHLKVEEGFAKKQLEKIKANFDEKCATHARYSVLCAMTKDARFTSADKKMAGELLEEEREFCHLQNVAQKEKHHYALKHLILIPCDATVVEEAKRLAEKEVSKSLHSSASLVYNDLQNDKSTRKHKSSSFGGKLRDLFGRFKQPNGKMSGDDEQ